MKKVLLSILALVLIVGALGAAGLVGYQYGFRQGALTSTTSNGKNQVAPFARNFGPRGMPMMRNFGFAFGFGRAFGLRGFGMMGRGGLGFGVFSLLMLFLRIAFWVLVIWAIYMLITRSGWRLTRQPTQTPPAAVAPATPTEPKDNEPLGN